MENIATPTDTAGNAILSTSSTVKGTSHLEMPGTGDQKKLNVYCWRQILDQVPLECILRAERVSKEWQEGILRYLKDIRVRLQPAHIRDFYEKTIGSNCRILHLPEGRTHFETENLFEAATRKLGPSVVATFCCSEANLLSITRNCPNLEHLALVGSGSEDDLWLDTAVSNINANKLKQISFQYIDNADDSIGKLIGSDRLEELIILKNKHMTGQCLTELKSTSLKTLSLTSCKSLELPHLLSSINHLNNLTKLELTNIALEIYQNIHLILKAMPKLEVLVLNRKKAEADDSIVNRDIADSIGRLGYLRHLDLVGNPTITDAVLEAVGRGCGQLQMLNVSGCPVTASAVVELCRAMGPSFEELFVENVPTMDEQRAAACNSHCPSLTVYWTGSTSRWGVQHSRRCRRRGTVTCGLHVGGIPTTPPRRRLVSWVPLSGYFGDMVHLYDIQDEEDDSDANERPESDHSSSESSLCIDDEFL